MTRVFDPVRIEVFGNRLLAITDEMGANLIRSSFSTNIKERKDCSVAIFSGEGRLVAQASHIPVHLGSLHGGVLAVLRDYRREDIRPGDMFTCNDPYTTEGTHTSDISIIAPVFDGDGNLAFFVANLAHHTDIGGPVPGTGTPTNTSIFHEGIRLPAVRYVRGGEIDESMERVIALNSRDPEERVRDLGAQVQTNKLGQRRLGELLAKFGPTEIEAAVEDLIAYSRARLEKRLAVLSSEPQVGEAWIDHGGTGGDKMKILVRVWTANGLLHFDFTGTSEEAKGAVNVPMSALRATCAYCIKVMLDPQLPANEGLLDRMVITAPEGCLVNPRYPAAVASRNSTCQRVARAILLAMGRMPELKDVLAPSADMNAAMVLSGPKMFEPGEFVYLETIGGGGGAYPDHDGMHAVQMHMTNTSNLPVEAMEIEYPLIVRTYALAEKSGGGGAYRGGAGIVREVEAGVDGIRVSARSDGMLTVAPGLHGGEAGGPAQIALLRRDAPPEIQNGALVSVSLRAGDAARLVTPGGGGFGHPEDRPAALVAQDARDGLTV